MKTSPSKKKQKVASQGATLTGADQPATDGINGTDSCLQGADQAATITAAAKSDVPEPEAFLDEAMKEPRRKLILDHARTIRVLRNEKKFTFSAIADWFNEKGFQTDRSAVYRAYLLTIPPDSLEELEEQADELRQMEPD